VRQAGSAPDAAAARERQGRGAAGGARARGAQHISDGKFEASQFDRARAHAESGT